MSVGFFMFLLLSSRALGIMIECFKLIPGHCSLPVPLLNIKKPVAFLKFTGYICKEQ